MLRITFVLGYFPAISETFIVNQINACIDAGHEVKIYAYRNGSTKNIHQSHLRHNLLDRTTHFIKKPKSVFKRYVVLLQFVFARLRQLNWKLLFRTLNFFTFGRNAIALNLFFEAQWFLGHNEHDVIHAHFGHNAQRIARLKSYGFLTSAKLVTTFHGFDLAPNKVTYYTERYSALFNYCDWFTVNTRYLEQILFPLTNQKTPISILPVGLDTHFFEPKQGVEKHKNFTLIFCGRLIELKGADDAVRIVSLLKEQGYEQIQLRIIGTGNAQTDIEKLIANLHLEENIHLLGALTQEEVKREMQQAHVFLMPGKYDSETGRAETQGLVIQEAQAMKLPVVVSDVGGMKYGLRHEVTGYVIPTGQVHKFAETIAFLIDNEQKRQSMGEEARLFVVKHYDSKILNEQLTHIYKKVFLP